MKKTIILFFSTVLLYATPFITDEKLKIGKLENGLSYYIYKNTTPKQSAQLYLYVDAGSTAEKEDEQGYAHFVEHMAFNGSADFDKNELISALEGFGARFGADLNAATSFDKTFYKLTIKTDQTSLETAFKVFGNMASKVLFNEKDVEIEKGIIIEEERKRNGPSKRIFEQEIPYIYGESIYAKRLPIGKIDMIKAATPRALKEFYQRNYFAQNLSFVAVGDFDVSQIETLIKTSFSSIKSGDKMDKIDKTIPFFDKLVLFNAYDEQTSSNEVRVSYEQRADGAINSYEKLKDETMQRYIGRLFKAINDRRFDSGESLIKSAFAPMNLNNQKRLNGFFSNVIGKDYKQSLSELFSLINGVVKFGFSESDFAAIKEDMIKENETFLSSEPTRSSSFYIHEILNFLDSNSTFLSTQMRYELTKKALSEISNDDVSAKFRQIVSAKGVIVELISQNKQNISKSEVVELLKAPAYNISDSKNLPKTLLDDSNLSVQKPVKSSFNKKEQIHTYEFSNGAVVYFKPLDTRKNTVLFSAAKKGGLSNFSDSKNARFAVEVSNGSGIGEFNDYEVTKITAGEQFSLTKFIDIISLGFDASSTTKDAKNMLKAFYADFIAPKISKDFAKNYALISKDTLEKNIKNPNFIFMREFMDFYYDGNEKMRAVSAKDIDGMDVSKMQKFLDWNYKNAAEFAFIFVGDIPEKELLDLAGRYIASLDGAQNKRSIDDDGVRSLDGHKRFERSLLSENVAKVQLFIKNDKVVFNRKNIAILDAATNVLNVLLREKIREQDSNVYGIYANSSLQKLPFANSVLHVNFSAAPQNVEAIIGEAKRIILQMQSGLVNEKYLNNFKISTKIALQKEYEQPSFWLAKIKNSYLIDEEMVGFDDQISLIDEVSLDDILAASRLYFDMANLTISVLKSKK